MTIRIFVTQDYEYVANVFFVFYISIKGDIQF